MIGKKSAFTVGEVLVTMAIVGVIAAMILPSIKQTQPDRQKLLFKKAYNNIERVVTELINDDYFYPEALKEDGTRYQGFDLTHAGDPEAPTVIISGQTKTFSGNTKFCELVALKLNTISTEAADIHCPGTPGGGGTFGTPSFITNEGIAYFIPSSDFANDVTITIDTNGEKVPNCKSGENNCKTPDIYEIIVSPDGGIHVEGEIEKAFLRSTSVMKD